MYWCSVKLEQGFSYFYIANSLTDKTCFIGGEHGSMNSVILCNNKACFYVQLQLSLLEDKYADEDEPSPNARNRLLSYRQMVFWCWPDISRGTRRPLPSCLVHHIRTTFPPTDDEERLADYEFINFAFGDDD
jgi:hypothetical protein